VLNSGYRKGKRVFRCKPSTLEPEEFHVYCPKALAGIQSLPGTLAHRSIRIQMLPIAGSERVEDFDFERADREARELRLRLRSFAQHSQDPLRDEVYPEQPDELDARGKQIWRILFRIADLAGGVWPQEARQAALALSAGSEQAQERSLGVERLAAIRDVFTKDPMPSFELVAALTLGDEPWCEWLNPSTLAKKLKPYGIRPRTIRLADGHTPKGYHREQFEEALARYLPPEAATSATTHYPSQKQAATKPPQKHPCGGYEGTRKPA
jgi:Protein of unknown function (DUF3631)